MRSTTVAIACATLCAAWCASAARAGIVHFVNPEPGQPGHYDWRYEPGAVHWLDITMSSQAQSNAPGGASVSQAARNLWGLDSNVHTGNEHPQFARVLALSGGWSYPSLSLEFGEPVQAHFFHTDWYSSAEHVTDPSSWPGMSLFPEGQSGYMGVLTASGNRGWIEVVRNGMSLTARAWAYQTEPGVPITAGQVPAPGAAVLLGLGIATSRRRRS